MSDPVLYFFFTHSNNNKNTAVAAVRSMLYQALNFVRKKSTTPKQLHEDVHACAKANAKALPKLCNLLLQCLAELTNPIIVVDGVDECIDNSSIYRIVRDLAQDTPTRIIATARPNIVSNVEVASILTLQMGLNQTRGDIEAYIAHRTQKGLLCSTRSTTGDF